MSAAEDRAKAIGNGDRRALARAITLVESTRPDHRREALALLDAVMPQTGKAIRLGISGAPGVGKSTFIEALGMQLIEAGRRLAVLAVDPTSARAGGSILGDKTRMEALGRSANAFIRPSPSGTGLGGIARRSREALLLCEAAGFDVVIVETVGVGQAEIAVRDMVDMFLLLVAPAGGDDLQGIKRGIVEIADLLVVNKADGELTDVAIRTRADYQSALDLLRTTSPNWRVPVLAASALEGTGIAEVWQAVEDHRTALDESGERDARRAQQALAWMWSEVSETLAARLRASPAVAARLSEVEAAVSQGRESPTAAAASLLATFLAEN
ncbi:MAG: methylmalonyl Co-A mutase-associated GTPase MeaB [Alphaproteobacteria bacterium]|nr:methylmalonyl Co-A mutase-associated GTPase MeaB [Alphaproteobacteria bacterium]